MFSLRLVDEDTGQELIWDLDSVKVELQVANLLLALDSFPHSAMGETTIIEPTAGTVAS